MCILDILDCILNVNGAGASSLAADLLGVIVDKFLEVVRRVILGLEQDDVALWQEVAHQDGVQAEEHGQGVEGLDVLAVVDAVLCEEEDPGEDEQQQAERDGLGLVVVLGQVFPHVGQSETEDDQQGQQHDRHEEQRLKIRFTGEDDFVRVQVGLVDRTGGAGGVAGRQQHSLQEDRQHDQPPLAVVLHVQAVELGELGGHFEGADDLEGVDPEARQTGGVEQHEGQIPQDAAGDGRLVEVEEDADGAHGEGEQDDEAHQAPSGLDHGRVVVDSKEDGDGQREHRQDHSPDDDQHGHGVRVGDVLHRAQLAGRAPGQRPFRCGAFLAAIGVGCL